MLGLRGTMDCVVILFGLQRLWKREIVRILQEKKETPETRIRFQESVFGFPLYRPEAPQKFFLSWLSAAAGARPSQRR
jgi:hypothetical protein